MYSFVKGRFFVFFLWYTLELTENMNFLLKITLSFLWRFIQNIRWSIIYVRLKSIEGTKKCSVWRPEVIPCKCKEEIFFRNCMSFICYFWDFFCYYYEYTQETECHIKRTSVIIIYMMEECNDSLSETSNFGLLEVRQNFE